MFVSIPFFSNKTIINRFFFTTAYHGAHLRSWAKRSELLFEWRRRVDAYPDLNISVFHDEGLFLDLIENMPTDAWQSALATLLCMGLICFIFMYKTFTVLVASSIIASILIGKLSEFGFKIMF